MSKHDTFVRLKAGHPFHHIDHLFPDGYPMRDPWGMGRSKDGKTILWIIDMDRLEQHQKGAIVINLAEKHGVHPQEIIDDSPEGFAIASEWVESMTGGVENYRRSIELADFLEANPKPNKEAYEAFYQQQYRDWIDGDRIPEPYPENYEEIDKRFKSPEFEKAFKMHQIEKYMSEQNYSVFDILTGKAMTETLNHIDPDSHHSLISIDEFLED